MVLERQGEPLTAARAPRPGAGRRPAAAQRPRLRRLPDRPAPPRPEIEATKLPVVLGHQIVGAPTTAAASACRGSAGPTASAASAPAAARTCASTRRFTGRDIDGGFAELTVADERYLLPAARRAHRRAGGAAAVRRPDRLPRAEVHRRRAAPRALRLRLGRAHDLPGRRPPGPRRVRVHPRRATRRSQEFARALGAEWAGGSDEQPPEPLDAAIIFASAGELVPAALRALAPGGSVVCAGIHMTDIPSFPYDDLWGERADPLGREPDPPGRRGVPGAGADRFRSATTITTYRLDQAEQALADLRAGPSRAPRCS